MNATFGGHERILYIWHSGKPVADCGNVIEADVEALSQALQNGGSVQVENSDRLDLAAYPASSFDAVVIRMFSLMSVDACAIALKLLKCDGLTVVLFAGEGATYDQIASNLRLSGFSGFDQIPKQSRDLEIHCKKPSFEVGASSKLTFATARASLGLLSSADAAKPANGGVWNLNTNDTIEDDLVTEDDLLTADDFVKPNPATLKVSGCSDNAAAGAPKKACKNCTCGLAEELAGVATQPKSACGSSRHCCAQVLQKSGFCKMLLSTVLILSAFTSPVDAQNETKAATASYSSNGPLIIRMVTLEFAVENLRLQLQHDVDVLREMIQNRVDMTNSKVDMTNSKVDMIFYLLSLGGVAFISVCAYLAKQAMEIWREDRRASSQSAQAQGISTPPPNTPTLPVPQTIQTITPSSQAPTVPSSQALTASSLQALTASSSRAFSAPSSQATTSSSSQALTASSSQPSQKTTKTNQPKKKGKGS